MTTEAELQIPDKLVDVFACDARYRGAYGGRGSGKTRTFALMTAVIGYQFGMAGIRGQILCGREFMNSLADSSFEEIKSAILSVDWLANYYECGDRYIRSIDGNINYTFSGLRHSLDSVKSKSKILIAWIDEAEPVSEEAWRKLIPTVREHNSEIWVTWNPESKDSATHERFRLNPPNNSKIAEINWSDNPFFPDVLNQERLQDKEKRPEIYNHVWEGGFLEFADEAYYNEQFIKVKDEKRICRLPRLDSQPCMTFWDIGNSDGCAVIVVQRVGQEYRCIDFYEAWGKPYSHAVQWLQSLGLVWDTMFLPHDAAHERQGEIDNKSPKAMLENLMPNVNFEIVARTPEINWGIQQTRDMFPMLWFDELKCEKLIDHLRAYRRKWSTSEKRWLNKPDKSEGHSEAADALRQMAQAYASGQLNTNNKWQTSGAIKRGLKGVA